MLKKSPPHIKCHELCDVWIFPKFYLRSNFSQEIKDFFDIADAFLPAADDLLPPHLGSNVAVDSWRYPQQQFITFLWLYFFVNDKTKLQQRTVEHHMKLDFTQSVFSLQCWKIAKWLRSPWTTFNVKMLWISEINLILIQFKYLFVNVKYTFKAKYTVIRNLSYIWGTRPVSSRGSYALSQIKKDSLFHDCVLHKPLHVHAWGQCSYSWPFVPISYMRLKRGRGITEVKSSPIIFSQSQQETDSQIKGLNLGHFHITVLQKWIQLTGYTCI